MWRLKYAMQSTLIILYSNLFNLASFQIEEEYTVDMQYKANDNTRSSEYIRTHRYTYIMVSIVNCYNVCQGTYNL